MAWAGVPKELLIVQGDKFVELCIVNNAASKARKMSAKNKEVNIT